MAKQKSNPGNDDAGTDTLENDDDAGAKINIKDWTGEDKTDKEPDDESGKPGDASAKKKDDDADVWKDAGDDDVDEPKKKEKIDAGHSEEDIIGSMSEGLDNDFSLDDDSEGDEDGDDEESGKTKTTKSDDSNLNPVARIAKEFELGDVQDAEQLISALNNKLAIAKAGSLEQVVILDKFINMDDRDLVKAKLMRDDEMTDEQAEAYMDKRITQNGEGWIDIEAEDVRLGLAKTRSKVINDHVSRENEERNKSAQFYTAVRSTAKELKTVLGIPLKSYVPKLKEFNAQISTNAAIDKMRNDPKLLAEAYFALTYGKTILNDFLKTQGKEKFERGWSGSFNQNVKDKILNKGKGSGNFTESSSKGSKDGSSFDINEYNKNADD